MKKYFTQLILLLCVTISCQNKMEEKFEWLPTESAPSLYPMNIYMGNLYFEDGGSVDSWSQLELSKRRVRRDERAFVGDSLFNVVDICKARRGFSEGRLKEERMI